MTGADQSLPGVGEMSGSSVPPVVVVREDLGTAVVPTALSVPLEPPTLGDAFTLLCRALEPYLVEQLPDQLRCQEIQGWYANGNHVVSWQVAVQILSQVLGAKLAP